jgi:hypothetical protein
MEIIKKIVYVLFGIISNVIIPITILYKSNFKGILGIIALVLIILVIIVVQTAIFFLFEKMIDEGKYTGKIFPMFWWMFIRQRKKTYHSKLGWFDLYIFRSVNKIFVYKQGFFHCLEIGEVSLEHSDVPHQIKEVLDREYRSVLEEKDERDKQNELIAKVIKWDGYLDTETRRDKKINDLGI